MIVYVNNNNEIKDVDITSDKNLIPLEISDENNPFSAWSVAKICCYKVNVVNGFVTMYTPYVDSKIIEHIDRLGKNDNGSDARIASLEEAVDILVLESLGM